ncbi:MAG TPA: tRNA 2-thiouridine(34) synthase MnmA, partial [Paludibacter sp.]|nr:tRNA 2-thiouridine(34) synthase MnmA [Paludibacter sp.]
KIFKTDNGYQVLSSEKIHGIAPGQFGVIYDADSKICIGSGEIISA